VASKKRLKQIALKPLLKDLIKAAFQFESRLFGCQKQNINGFRSWNIALFFG
jgi:hypothetical protein